MLGRLGESSRSLGAHCVGCPMVQGTHPIRSILECLVAKVLLHASVNDAPLSLLDGYMNCWGFACLDGRKFSLGCAAKVLDARSDASYVGCPNTCIQHSRQLPIAIIN